MQSQQNEPHHGCTIKADWRRTSSAAVLLVPTMNSTKQL